MPQSSRSLLALLVLALAGRALAQQPPVQIQVPSAPNPAIEAPDQIVTFHANARAVLLDVVVTDGHGHPVRGLKPEDFHLFEDGQPQTVASLEERKPLTPEELAAQPKLRDLPPNTFSNRKAPPTESAATVFLLDALDSSVEAQMFTREQLLSWVKTKQPGTMVAIFQVDTQVALIQGFTSDPVLLENAIRERYKPVLSVIPKGNGYVTAVSQMNALTGAFQAIGTYLATRPGRKNLIWFTTHAPRSAYDDGTYMGGWLHDSQSFLFDYAKATDALVLGQVSVYPIDTRGLETNPALSAEHGGPVSNRSNTNFAGRNFLEHNELDRIAEATGGHAFYNMNGIKQMVSQIIETGSSYYTLSFYPTNKKWDGSYRKLKVESDRPGLTLEYRPGYYARPEPTPPRQQEVATRQPLPDRRIQLTNHSDSINEAAFARAMHLGAVDPGQIVFVTHVDIDPALQRLEKNQPLPKDNYLEPKYRDHPFRNYKVLCIIPASQVQLDLVKGLRHGSLQVNAVLVDDKDQLVNSLDTQLSMDLKPDTYALAMQKGIYMPINMAVPEKGTYFLRVGVHDRITGKSGTIEMNTGDIKLNPVYQPPAPAK